MTTAHPLPEPALATGEDPREFAQVLHAMHDAAMAGQRLPARPRSVIGQSWARVAHAGVDPDIGGPIDPIAAADLTERRAASGLGFLLDDLTRGLDAVLRDSPNILVVADAKGHVLWRAGTTAVRRRADGLGFVEGASWAENAVGTNAIGTALTAGQAVQVFSAEHYVRSHHAWTCTGAPIRDPRSSGMLGVVDVSGPASSIHPATIALVDSVARLAEARLQNVHRDQLDMLRSVAAPILARAGRPALAVDEFGWVAAVDRVEPRRRIVLPSDLAPSRVLVSGLGLCDVEPLPGGWLVRPADAAEREGTTVTIGDVVTVTSGDGVWTHNPSPRHRDLLTLLARNRGGLSAAELAGELFGDPARTVTVRAEMSRLRKTFGGLLATAPYRFAKEVTVSR
ncbi:GAF domain-containing protein [Gordonia sp. HY285]|uniref:helix-turn-helix domain-containing protein n=1 Tax=Gordonia liuliyuniae TaxID=2911517 RepID=UPI001EFFFBBE|nr:helix-turn-helix domain-containing protein [Gordonia liuliyuniae]MCF8608801.1 GAF domain-containing protein [Gordonia liuliyuniae]